MAVDTPSLSAKRTFFRGFLKHPVMVASVIPTWKRVIKKMLARVDLGKADVIVEYGPGVGAFTGPILDRMHSQAKLIVIDTNAHFIDYLTGRFDDARLIPTTASADAVCSILSTHGLEQADYIISGIPFLTLPPGLGDRIVAQTVKALKPGGAFLVYLFSSRVHAMMAPYFARIDYAFEPINMPPARLYWAWKPSED